MLQKDVWVCWALKELFGTQRGVRMAFKGGTSLSKVFQAIHRFSEDVDVSLDYRDLQSNPEFDPFDEGISKSKRKQFSERLFKVINPPSADEFARLKRELQHQAHQGGLRQSDIPKAISKVRGRR